MKCCLREWSNPGSTLRLRQQGNIPLLGRTGWHTSMPHLTFFLSSNHVTRLDYSKDNDRQGRKYTNDFLQILSWVKRACRGGDYLETSPKYPKWAENSKWAESSRRLDQQDDHEGFCSPHRGGTDGAGDQHQHTVPASGCLPPGQDLWAAEQCEWRAGGGVGSRGFVGCPCITLFLAIFLWFNHLLWCCCYV